MAIGEKGIVRNSSAFILNDVVAGRAEASDGEKQVVLSPLGLAVRNGKEQNTFRMGGEGRASLLKHVAGNAEGFRLSYCRDPWSWQMLGRKWAVFSADVYWKSGRGATEVTKRRLSQYFCLNDSGGLMEGCHS